jgi:hypothetical protein
LWEADRRLQAAEPRSRACHCRLKATILLETRLCAGESDAEMVAGVWDFERINRRYVRHLKILEERPGTAL